MTISNITDARRDLMNEVREIARAHGNGALALVHLAGTTVRAAYDGLVNMEKDNDGLDDAKRIFAEYQKAYSSKDEFGSLTQQVSKLRAFIKLGAHATVDGVTTFNRANEIYGDLKRQGVKTKTQYQALVDVAVRQNASQSELSDDEISALISKDQKETTEIALLKSAYKALEKAIAINPRDESENAARSIGSLIAMIEQEAERAEKLAMIAQYQQELGIAA